MEQIIGLVFILIAILWTLETFTPGWRAKPASWAWGFSIGGFIAWLLGLLAIYIVYRIVLIVFELFGGALVR